MLWCRWKAQSGARQRLTRSRSSGHNQAMEWQEQVFCGQSRAILPLCLFLSSNVGLREIRRERWGIL